MYAAGCKPDKGKSSAQTDVKEISHVTVLCSIVILMIATRKVTLILKNSTFCPHSVFMCFVRIWEQTAIISLYSINWLVCITETECVYCAVRTEHLNKFWLPAVIKFRPNSPSISLCLCSSEMLVFAITSVRVWWGCMGLCCVGWMWPKMDELCSVYS